MKIIIDIPDDTHKKLKEIKFKTGLAIYRQINASIEQYLKRPAKASDEQIKKTK
jgi:hypothetical protein